MASLVLNGRYRITYHTLLGAQVGAPSLAYEVTALAGTVTENEVLVNFATVVPGLIKALLPADAEYRGMIIRRLSPLPLTAAVSNNTDAGIGAVAADPLPKQTSGIVSMGTLLRGQANRGRFFMPFPTEDDNDPALGRPNAVYLANLDNLMAWICEQRVVAPGGGSATLIPVLVHGDGSSMSIVTHVAKPYWATQRRRGDYGSPNISPI